MPPQKPVIVGDNTQVARDGESAGGQIGPYRLLEVIGEGGFGSVHLAEQTEPIKRKVALKIIKLGMDTRQVIARFEAERQALAMMDHPNIARVLDAGATESGRPYFVMEWVRGIPITQFCDRHMLSTRERLELLIPVCQAVQHAHQKGIIHRDIKPSNVLVALEEDRQVPKVIDFGIAKAMHTRLTDKTVHTEFRQIVGTFEYMSPEQAEHSGLDVDTRTDIYSLGVLMYELLTGETPFDAQTLRSMPFGEIPRVLMEREPPRPSTRVRELARTARPGSAAMPEGPASSSAATTHSQTTSAAEVAKHRKTDVASLQRSLRGELDWIAMKCLEKDRTRRYASAQELGQDIRRYLNNEVVLASPPSAAYKLRKFARRHRLGISVTGVVLAAIIGGLVMGSIGFVRARQEAERARTQAARAEAVAGFLRSMLAAVDPSVAKGRDTSLMRDILADAGRRIAGSFGALPEVEATLREVMARAFSSIGIFDESAAQASRALELRKAALGPNAPETFSARLLLATARFRQSRYKAAEEELSRLIDDATHALGADHNITTGAMFQLANVHGNRGRGNESAALLEKVLAIRERVEPGDSIEVLNTRIALVRAYRQLGRRDEALTIAERTVEVFRKTRGDEAPATLQAMHSLAAIYLETGREEQGESLYKQVVATRRRILGEEHFHTLESLGELGTYYIDRNRLKEAEPLLVARLEGGRRRLSDSSEDLMAAIGDVAELYRAQKRFAEAEPLYMELLRKWRAAQGPLHPNVLAATSNLVSMYLQQERWAEAEQEALALVSNSRKSVLADHWYLGTFLTSLGAAHVRMGHFDDAQKCFDEADAILSKTFDEKEKVRQNIVVERRKLAAAQQRQSNQSTATQPH